VMANSLLQLGSAGIQMGLQQAGHAAADIAGAVHDNHLNNGALASSAVDLLQAEHHVKASAQMVRAADELLGAFIDTFA